PSPAPVPATNRVPHPRPGAPPSTRTGSPASLLAGAGSGRVVVSRVVAREKMPGPTSTPSAPPSTGCPTLDANGVPGELARRGRKRQGGGIARGSAREHAWTSEHTGCPTLDANGVPGELARRGRKRQGGGIARGSAREYAQAHKTGRLESSLALKGRGFSPAVNTRKNEGASAPEGIQRRVTSASSSALTP